MIWRIKMRSITLIFLVFFSSVTYSQVSSGTYSCTPSDNYNIPFKITHEGNTLILEMRNKQYQLSFKERYMGKSGYEHYVFRNNLLEVITAENGTSVFTLSTHTKDQTITFGKCK